MMRIKPPLRAKVPTFLATTVTVGVVALFATGGTTAAAQSQVRSEVSENWAGYAVTGKKFARVSGTWREPTVKASSSSSEAYSAVWVGLGGYKTSSSSLEQIGTAADYVGGHAEYYAWYELLPSAQVRLNIAIRPGDEISARVSVTGTSVTVSLSDRTTGHSVVKTLHMSQPDTSSAEWIVEAPATETFGGNYQVLPLADFAKVAFSKATATAGRYVGGISGSQWTPTRIQLRTQSTFGAASGSGFVTVGPQAVSQQSDGATTSTLSGNTFSVSWQASNPSQATSGGQPAVSQYPPVGGPFPAGGSGYGPGPAFPDVRANSGR
jgi:Peptidase A4 family